MEFGKFKIHIIRESTFRLDGGAMFGVVPKSMWGKTASVDNDNRVLLSCNLLLIESPDGVVLVETGMGSRWTDKEKERYELKSLINHEHALESVGMKNDDVNAVLISHLHFDHVGGATISREGKILPTYPRATYFAQKGEWEAAYTTNPRARGSYRRDDFEPLEELGVLELLDGDKEILPGIKAVVSGGHTKHHQVVTFESMGKKGIYFADIIPSKAHLSPPWVMGYDHYPLETCDIKSHWLGVAAAEEYLVVFDHETDVPWGFVRQDAGGRFQWDPLRQETLKV